jgi:peptidoglycan hydrolase-like protein with peptidoglycan-binding domain
VTSIALAAGATPHTLQRLVTVSGKPIYAFVSSSPLYKTLSTSLASGAQKTNVAALQRALKAAGYFSGTVSGEFGSSTRTALEDWQADHGLSKTGEVTTNRFVWVPAGAVIESWSVIVGSSAGSGTTLATVDFPRPLVATAAVSQADIARLKVGQKATLTISDSTTSLTGTITAIASEPASSSSSGSSASSSSSSSSTIAEYEVTFALSKVPTSIKSGMTGSLTVTIAKRSNVLIVPTSAVSGTSAASYVRVLKNGRVTEHAVTTGMATSSLTQIMSGLVAGATVVTGTYTPDATASSTSTSNSRSLLNSLSGGGSGGAGPPGQ